jgi:hypothetical protein
MTPRKRRWPRKVMKRVGFISNFETRDLTHDSFVSVVSIQDEMYLEGVITCKKYHNIVTIAVTMTTGAVLGVLGVPP